MICAYCVYDFNPCAGKALYVYVKLQHSIKLKLAMIPNFNISNVLPPFVGQDPTLPALCSPYESSMSDFVQRFGISAERIMILKGLLAYRAQLKAVGITSGFQVLDGSFVEDCEKIRNRPPSDIDLVTFSYLPVAGINISQFVQTNIELFDQNLAKIKYKCDAYFVDLGKDSRLIVEDSFYWYGLFSHQRDTNLWKGMVRIPLMSDDALVRLP